MGKVGGRRKGGDGEGVRRHSRLIDIASEGRGGYLHATSYTMCTGRTGVCVEEAGHYEDLGVVIKGREKCGGTRCHLSGGTKSASLRVYVKQEERMPRLPSWHEQGRVSTWIPV